MGGRYLEPTTIEEAVALAAEHAPQARFVAGGTDLVVLARKSRTPLPDTLIAIHRISELRGVTAEADGSIRIAGGTTHAQLESDPTILRSLTAIADGAALVGSPATRHVGTLGGNLCNASPANETGSPLLVFGASVELASPSERRTFPLERFFVGPGETTRRSDELLVAVKVPPADQGGGVAAAGSAYLRLDYRLAMEIAVVGAAVAVALDGDGKVTDARLALTAVAPMCVEVPGIAEALRGRQPTEEVLREAERLAAEAAQPIDDVRAPADYRQAMVPVVVRRAFRIAVRRALGEVVPVPATLTVNGSSEVA